MTKNEIYEKALDTFGKRNQLKKTREELIELYDEILIFLSDDCQIITKNLAEEIADVEIMIEQLRRICGDKNLDIIKQQKLERLQRLVEEANDV